jgi:hypothetical protein
MTCHDARELFSDWADDALTAEERARVDAHLAGCADCRKELERFTAAIALLHRMERPRAPAGFVDRVLAAKQGAPWYRRLFQRLFLPLSVKLPAEAAALLLVAGLAVYVFQRTPELQQAARPAALRPAARPEAPPAPTSPPAPATVLREAPSGALRDQPSRLQLEARRKEPVAPEDTRLSRSDEASRVAPKPGPQAPAALPSPSVEPTVGQKKEGEPQGFATPGAPAQSASKSRPVPAEEAGKPAPPTAPPAPAPGGGPGVEPRAEVTKEARAQESGAARAPAPAPQPRAAPATEGRADSARQNTMRSPAPMAPAPGSAMRVLPSADVVGRLAVKDRGTAERALGDVLARAGGVVISRREEAGITVVEVVVPKATYPDFSKGLALIGVWRPERPPSELPPNVRVTLRLVE